MSAIDLLSQAHLDKVQVFREEQGAQIESIRTRGLHPRLLATPMGCVDEVDRHLHALKEAARATEDYPEDRERILQELGTRLEGKRTTLKTALEAFDDASYSAAAIPELDTVAMALRDDDDSSESRILSLMRGHLAATEAALGEWVS
jgi:hypothetical protein